MCDRRCFFFVDNDSARDGLIAAYSPVNESMHLIYEFLVQDFVSPIHAWFSRIQSASNPGDDPSRLKYSQLVKDWPRAKWLDTTAACRALNDKLMSRRISFKPMSIA